MKLENVRYLVARRRADGTVRYYWQPSSRLRKLGWQARRLSNDRAVAIGQAEGINRQLDADRQPPAAADAKPDGWPRDTPLKYGRRCVYVVGSLDGPYKIGISAVPFRRLATLQGANAATLRLLLLLDSHPVEAATVEAQTHRRLSSVRRNGEWFETRLDIVIAAVLDVHLELLRGHHAATFSENKARRESAVDRLPGRLRTCDGDSGQPDKPLK